MPDLFKTVIKQLSIDVNSLLIYKSSEIADHAQNTNIMRRLMMTAEKIHYRVTGTPLDNRTHD